MEWKEDFKIKFYYFKSFDKRQWDIVYDFLCLYATRPYVILETKVSKDRKPFYILLDLSDYYFLGEVKEPFDGKVHKCNNYYNRPLFLPKFDYSFEITFQRDFKLDEHLLENRNNFCVYGSDYFYAKKDLMDEHVILGLISVKEEEFKKGTSKWVSL